MNRNSGEEFGKDNVPMSTDFACPCNPLSQKLNPEYAISSMFQTVGEESIKHQRWLLKFVRH
jgi:hypothetical protein